MNQEMLNFLLIFLTLVSTVACIILIIVLIRIKYLSTTEFIKEENKRFAMNSSYDPENELILLDVFIMECFKSYQSTVLSREKLVYINDDMQIKIIKDLAEIADARMSDNLRYKLSKYYKEDAINDIVAEKIYSAVLAFVIQNNEPK